VCACCDAGFRSRSRHATAASAAIGRATRTRARRSVMGGGSSEIAKGAGRCPQVDNRLWAKDRPRRPWALPHGHGLPSRAHPPLRRPPTGSSMEGTSGAADPVPLRGGAGGAALGGVAREQPRTGRLLLAGDAQGIPQPAQNRSLQPVMQRFRDERCPSGSGREKTLLRSSTRTTPEERRSSNEARSWPVKARLASVLSGPFQAGAQAHPWERPARHRHPGSMQGPSSSREASVSRAGAVCEPRESGAGGRSARAHARAERDGDRTIVRACSRVVVVAEVDERRLVQTERSRV